MPVLAVLRVLSPAGPYQAGDLLSLACTSTGAGRLVAHVPAEWLPQESLVPEVVTARVVDALGAYHIGDVLTLSFVNPSAVRVHPAQRMADQQPKPTESTNGEGNLSEPPGRNDFHYLENAGGGVKAGVWVRSAWDGARVRRFAQLTDKLFAIDRLGWYRHALTMRLLIADQIVCRQPDITTEATRRLGILRSATSETLGAPLLAAFMPNFAVTPEWLDTIDDLATAKALAGVVEAIAPYLEDTCTFPVTGATDTTGPISRAEFASAPSGSVEALLPLLIPTSSRYPKLSDGLRAYRETLLELFGQAAASAGTVRLRQMSVPNPLLDDRLRLLSGALRDSLEDASLEHGARGAAV